MQSGAGWAPPKLRCRQINPQQKIHLYNPDRCLAKQQPSGRVHFLHETISHAFEHASDLAGFHCPKVVVLDRGIILCLRRYMIDFGPFEYDSRQQVLETRIRYWNPDKTRFWHKVGIDLVMGSRDGYRLLLTPELCQEILERFGAAMTSARELLKQAS